jgi:hypothetical protein
VGRSKADVFVGFDAGIHALRQPKSALESRFRLEPRHGQRELQTSRKCSISRNFRDVVTGIATERPLCLPVKLFYPF